ncbi:MAG: chromosome segregation protein SMC [Chloroflexia bacterium]|nr:chromosome segregation protein SMC [Chloroflexia bacterium]
MTLLLKRLDIHGFKSFATPTTFAFDRGITAIVGPNGSGKSNVSEALRWVLGESQYSNLRGRKTEDILFAGSDRRAPLGMAEVVLTLDNSDGDLPLEFSEITVARRAYRSGESQYLINGSRVRLKDIQQLTAPLGQSHTIIGQGLVDAVLSQRPEDRRGLFEHAAGITGLRLRANDAERGLAETAGNAQRLHDILAELEPRVRSLERSARQAREYGVVRDRLSELQRCYYGALWSESATRIDESKTGLAAADGRLKSIEETHQQTSRELAGLRSRERQLLALETERGEKLSGHERDLATTRHQLELLAAEARSVETRLTDLKTSQSELETQRAAAQTEADRLSKESVERRALLESLETQFALRERNARSAQEQRAERERELAGLEQSILNLSRQIAESEGRLQSFSGRLAGFESERGQLERQIQDETERQQAISVALTTASQKRAELEHTLEGCSDQLTIQQEELTGLRQVANEQQSEIGRAERDLAGHRSRLELLERTYESGEGLHAGVRALLRAARRGKLDLPGLRGTLAELIDVPKAYETAMEVALGGHLQDVIVERWSDAETAIAYLKKEHAGRATFQPLDSVRQPNAPTLDVNEPGIAGIASTLVTYPDEIAPVVQQTLNRTLIVDDLETTRRILKRARGWTLVTLAGEITRPSGSVTGGSGTRSAGLLARERDRRTLPQLIEKRERELVERREALASGREASEALEIRITTERHEIEQLRIAASELDLEHDRLRRDRSNSHATIERLEAQAQSLEARNAQFHIDETGVRAELDEHTATRRAAQVARDELAASIAASPVERDEPLAELRVEIASARERLRSLDAGLERARHEAAHSGKALESRAVEIARLTGGRTEQAQQRAKLETAISRLQTVISNEQAEVEPLLADRQSLAPRIATAEQELDRSIGGVRDAERARDRAALDLARRQDEQVFLSERVRNDLGVEDPATLIPEAGETGEHVEKEINRLRERLRRMSAVGEDVLEEHAAESERLQFLTSQLDDVEQAAASLRSVLADLNRKMANSFSETFTEVAAEFEQTFKRLFGGGTAKLSQRDEEDEPGGVDIVAQPPGKRLQGLNQLSGGERALTAVALLVAIQRVNPSPFCLLDEVDAALDESNVVRFKDELRDLATTTQFVVITHNRGTIEGADTLYGVTMGDDGVSRTISLRLDEAIQAVEEQQTASVAG